MRNLLCVGRQLSLSALVLGLVVGPAGVASAAAPAPSFVSILDLGTLGGTSAGWAVNDLGQVTGPSALQVDSSSPYRAFRTAANAPINPATDNLGTLGGTGNSVGSAVNNLGQVAGSASLPNGRDGAFRTAPGAAIDPATSGLGTLGQPDGAVGDTDGRDINNLGQVVGSSRDSLNRVRAFRTAPNAPIDPVTSNLGTLGGGWSNATAINDHGQVAGESETAGSATHAFRTAANAAINPLTDDLGTLGGTFSSAAAINLSGQVAGMSTTAAGINRAFLTRPGAAAIDPLTDDLGTLDGHTFSLAEGVNDAGDVVGRSWGTVNGLIEELPFLYTGGEMYDLNALLPAGSGWRLIDAYDISNAGQIVGYGTNSAGESRAFLLTVSVPEPGAFALLALAGCTMLRRHRAKK